jgi:hypothetical protein
MASFVPEFAPESGRLTEGKSDGSIGSRVLHARLAKQLPGRAANDGSNHDRLYGSGAAGRFELAGRASELGAVPLAL